MPPHPSKTPHAAAHAEISASVDAFRRILRALRVSARKGELSTGLSAAQLFVLSVLAEQQKLSVNDVAAATMTDRSSAAAVIDRLVERGYAVREQSARDRRRAEISITAPGRRAIRHAAPPTTTLLIRGLRALSEHQRAGLAHGLAALTQAMGIAHEPAGMLFEDAPRRSGRTRGSRHG